MKILVSSVKKCFFVLLAFTLVIKISLYILKRYYNFWLLIGNINGDTIEFFICVLTGIFLSIYLFLMLSKKWKKALIVFATGLILLIYTFFYQLSQSDSKYFYFNSPNGVNTLVVEENSWLLAGWSDFYIKKNLLFVKVIDNKITTDDGYRPFTNGDYKLSWINEDKIKITYGVGDLEKHIDSEIINLK